MARSCACACLHPASRHCASRIAWLMLRPCAHSHWQRQRGPEQAEGGVLGCCSGGGHELAGTHPAVAPAGRGHGHRDERRQLGCWPCPQGLAAPKAPAPACDGPVGCILGRDCRHCCHPMPGTGRRPPGVCTAPPGAVITLRQVATAMGAAIELLCHSLGVAGG